MPDKIVFLDSNIILYLYSEDEIEKQNKIKGLFKEPSMLMISNQVINEVSNILLKKFRVSINDVKSVISELKRQLNIVENTINTTFKAFDIHEKYRYSFWDSMIIASASENDASILYSEDMSHSQLIDNKLTIINPFVNL